MHLWPHFHNDGGHCEKGLEYGNSSGEGVISNNEIKRLIMSETGGRITA